MSVTVRLDPKVKTAIATIGEHAWTTIEYTDAVYDEQSATWVSRAEVAEVPFTAFSSKKATEQVPGRLVVRRIPDLNQRGNDGQDGLFDTWRVHISISSQGAPKGRTANPPEPPRTIKAQPHPTLPGQPLTYGSRLRGG